MNGKNLYTASAQWASRPDDERYLSLQDLLDAVSKRKQESWTNATDAKALRVHTTDDEQDLLMDVFDPEHGEIRPLSPSHWSFSQLSMYADAPASYLRKLPAVLAAINLQYGLEHNAIREDVLVLGQTNGSNTLRSMTSVSYGRIWDAQVVQAVINMNQNDIWQIPAASYATQNPKRATTLYASDRDVFIFMVDPNHPIEVPGEQHPMFRGFFIGNSEVGSATLFATMFLYERVCDNRIVWNASVLKELRIRHTGGAPERFIREAQPQLTRYANETTGAIVDGIVKAKQTIIDTSTVKDNSMVGWLQQRGFTKPQAAAAVQYAQAESGEVRSVWDIVNGITASARSITHTDARVALETKAGELMKLAK
jgi:hypothetical protein